MENKLLLKDQWLYCPNCSNDGYTVWLNNYGDWQQEQCEFCYIVEASVFN